MDNIIRQTINDYVGCIILEGSGERAALMTLKRGGGVAVPPKKGLNTQISLTQGLKDERKKLKIARDGIRYKREQEEKKAREEENERRRKFLLYSTADMFSSFEEILPKLMDKYFPGNNCDYKEEFQKLLINAVKQCENPYRFNLQFKLYEEMLVNLIKENKVLKKCKLYFTASNDILAEYKDIKDYASDMYFTKDKVFAKKEDALIDAQTQAAKENTQYIIFQGTFYVKMYKSPMFEDEYKCEYNNKIKTILTIDP